MKDLKNSKLRFNSVDFLIIVVVLGCVIGIAYKYSLFDSLIINGTRDTVNIHFVASAVTNDVNEKLVPGAEYSIGGTSEVFGKLKSVQSSDSKYISVDSNGNAVISYDKEHNDINGVFECIGVKNDNGFYIGGSRFTAPGSEFDLESGDTRISVIITEIS